MATGNTAQPYPKRNRIRVAMLAAAALAAVVIVVVTLFLANRDDSAVSAEEQADTSVQSFTDAFSDGQIDKLRDLSCGDFAASFSKTGGDEIKRQAVEALSVRGRGLLTDFRNTTITSNTAKTTATLAYEHAPNDPNHTGRPVTFQLEKHDNRWQVCSYSENS